MSSWRKPTPKALQMLPAYLSDARNLSQPNFGIEFHSADKPIELMPPAIRLRFDPAASYTAVQVSPEIVAETPDAALTLVRELVTDTLPFSSGWAGYTVAWNESMGLPMGEPYQQLRAWVMRYPGLGQGKNFALYDRALKGIACVNWLTLLGAELTERKGGATAIAAALGPDIHVHPLGTGVCIQAGPLPQLGDVNRGDDLPIYRRVGAFLKDIRTTEPERWLEGPEDNTEAWFARFDD